MASAKPLSSSHFPGNPRNWLVTSKFSDYLLADFPCLNGTNQCLKPGAVVSLRRFTLAQVGEKLRPGW